MTTSVLKTVSTEQEAELICGLLRSAGFECDRRATQLGESFGGGAQEVLVHAEDLEAAQALLPDEA